MIEHRFARIGQISTMLGKTLPFLSLPAVGCGVCSGDYEP